MGDVTLCLVTGQYPPQVGGVGHSAHRVANLLATSKVRLHVVALQKHPVALPFDESVTTIQEGDVLVHRVKVYYPDRSANGFSSEAEILTRYNREMFQALHSFQQRFQYDVLHAFFLYPAGYIVGLVGRLHKVRTIVSIRGNDIGKYAFDPLRLPFVRSALEHADQVTSVASNLVDFADRAITPIRGKARTILNSIDVGRMRARARPELNLKGTVIGTSGLFRYKKGLLYLFKALASLNTNFDFTLLLLGDFFSQEDRGRHLSSLAEYGLEDRTIITGKMDPGRMPDYLQLFDILVFPSLFSEGCPLSLLEAMAMKKPVIATRVGAIPEIIQHHQNGILVNPGSADEIAQGILELVERPGLRERLGVQAEKTVAHLTPERELADWLSAYEAAGVPLA